MKWRGLDRKCNGQEWGEMAQKGQEGKRVKWSKEKWSCVKGENRSGLVGNEMVQGVRKLDGVDQKEIK